MNVSFSILLLRHEMVKILSILQILGYHFRCVAKRFLLVYDGLFSGTSDENLIVSGNEQVGSDFENRSSTT